METVSQDAGHWLNLKRCTVYPRLVIAVYAVINLFRVATFRNLVDSSGIPVGADFISPWAASLAALQGHAADAYNPAVIFHYEQIAVPASQKLITWFYPPSLYLLILPLARIPYVASYLTYILTTLVFFVVVSRRGIEGSIAMWCLAGFSGVWINFMDGQNGFITAGLAGAGILCLRRRPYLAGVFVGLLSIKPHLGLLFPLALVAIGAWRTILSAAITAAGLLAASTALLGKATLTAWIGSMGLASQLLQGNSLKWNKMPTVFAAVRLLNGPPGLAYACQSAVAVCAVVAVWRVFRRSTDWQVRGAVLMTASLLVSPYVFDYDLVWLAFPIAWLAQIGIRDGWRRGDREVLAIAWIAPMFIAPLASNIPIQIGPVVLLALLWIGVRRSFHFQSIARIDAVGGSPETCEDPSPAVC